MGMLYRRKKKNPNTGQLEETGPWWMKFYDQGKPIYRSTEQYEKRDANKVLQKAEGKVAEGQRESPKIHQTRFEDLEKEIKLDYELKGRKTWIRRLQHLAHLRKVFGQMKVKSIITDRLQQYISKRMGEGASNATINRELDCLKRMLKIGASSTPPKVGRVPSFPKLKEDNVREGFFEHDEFLALRGACPDHLKIAVSIAYYTGMRQGEIISENGLRWNQVNLIEGTIRLRSNQTKTETPRVIYMTGDFLMVLLKAKELRDRDCPSCPFVCQREGKPFKGIKTAWKTACKRTELEGKTFHDLRRTGVRNLIRAGVPETVAMKISGHKTRSVFDRYNITSEEDLKEAATRLETYIQEKKVTLLVTPDQIMGCDGKEAASEVNDIQEENMEPASGVEPPTYGLRNRCSATELRRLSKGSGVRTAGLRYQNQPPSYFVRYPLSTRSGLSFASNPTTSRFSLPTL